MDPETIATTDRVHHGGSTDPATIDFSANTNPRTPPGTREIYKRAFTAAHRYPDDTYPAFRDAASTVIGCSETAIIPTAGGLDALRLALGTTVERGDTVAVPTPGFSEYAREVQLQGGTVDRVSPASILDVDPADYRAVIVGTPHNPTGQGYAREQLRAFADRCRTAGTVLVVDEAFLGFTEQASLGGTPGTIVCRSLTKLYGLPGLRAGYAVAVGDLQEQLATARETWSLSTPAAAVGTHCLESRAFVEATRRRVAHERERLRTRLQEEFTVLPSDAPFLLIDVGDYSVDAIREQASDASLTLRDARTFEGLDNHIRVAVREPAENTRLLEVLLDG